MLQPLVSIITPTFNCEQYLPQTIESVLLQSYCNWELIIVDDCSTDRTLEVAYNWRDKDIRIQVFSLDSNLGSGPARNFAIERAKGEFIAFLDGDDIWHKEKLHLQVNFMLENDIIFSHSSYGYISGRGKIISKIFEVSKVPVSYQDLLKRTEISCLTAIYNAHRIGKFYMPSIRRKQDYALWLEILKHGYQSYPFPEVLAWYRQTPNSSTSNKFKLIIKHFTFLRNHEGLNVFKSLKYTTYWMINGFIRYYI